MAGPEDLSERTWEEQLAWEAKEFQQTGRMSHDFAEALRGASSAEVDKFLALVHQNEQRFSRSSRIFRDRDDEMLYGDAADQRSKRVANRLHTVINKNPLGEEGQERQQRFVTNSIGITEPVPVDVPITPRTLKRRTEAVIKEQLRAKDPQTHELVNLAPQGMLDEFRHHVQRSYYAKTDNERLASRRQAERLANRIAQKAGKAQRDIDDRAHFVTQAQQIFGRDQVFNSQEQAKKEAARARIQTAVDKKGPVGEERLGGLLSPLTAADLYQSAGYDSKPLQRARYEAKALQARVRGDRAFDTTAKPKVFEQTRRQLRFNSKQTKNKISAAKEGTLTFGIDSSGHVVDPASKSAVLRVGPNREWRYVTHTDQSDPRQRKAVTVPYSDKQPHFSRSATPNRDEIAHRPRTQTYYDEHGHPYDIEKSILNERLVRKWEYPVNIKQGERHLKGTVVDRLPKDVSREVFIPYMGGARSSKYVSDPEIYEIREIQRVPQQESGVAGTPEAGRADTYGGEWFEATPEEWALATMKGKDGQTVLPTRRTRVQKKVKITHVDPSELELKRRQKDTLAFTVPGKKLSPEFRQKLLDKSLIDDNQYHMGERAVEFSLGDSRLSSFIQAPIHAQKEIDLRKKSWIAGRSKEIGVAAATAAYYAQLKRTQHGFIPNKVNQAWTHRQEKNPAVKNFAEKWSVDDLALPLEKAYVRPAAEKVKGLRYQVRHPLSSLEGTSHPGIDVGSIYFRQHGIKPEERRYRQVEKSQRELSRVLGTQKLVSENLHKSGVKGKVARWQVEPLKRHEDYRDFASAADPTQSFLAKTVRGARQARNDNPSGSKAYNAAVKLEKQARDLLHEDMEIKRHAAAHPYLPVPIIKRASSRSFIPALSPTEKKAAVGGVAIATAIGAHYAYHKHEQSKLPEIERQAYYNKVLPGPVRAKVPYAKSTAHYQIPANTITSEFGLAGKKPPVQWGVGVHNKTVWKGSPQDRGYGKNAKIGLLGVRGAGVKSEGSLKNALTYDPQSVFTRKRSFRPSGQKVIVNGQEMPFRVNIGDKVPIKLSRSNPNRLTQADREDIVWAFKGHPDEEKYVREFFSHGPGDRVLDMLDDPDAIQKIRRKRGEAEGRRLASESYVVPSYVGLASEAPVHDIFKGKVTDEDLMRTAIGGSMYDPHAIGFMGSGGTAGVEPYSQIGSRQTKADEVFIKGIGHVTTTRPVGTRRVGNMPAADIPARRYDKKGNKRHPMEQRPKRND